MPEMLPDFPILMAWFVLSLDSIAVALLFWSALHLPRRYQRLRAFAGCVVMASVSLAVEVSLCLFSLRGGPTNRNIGLWLLPLLVAVLTISLYRLTFPQSSWRSPASTTPALHIRHLLLLCLTCLTFLVAGALIVTELFLT